MNIKRASLVCCFIICILTVFRFKRFVHYDVRHAIKAPRTKSEVDQRTVLHPVQQASRTFPNFTSHVAILGPIDAHRTRALVKSASRILSRQWWKGRTCRCEQPIKDYILGNLPGVETHVYWTEAFRTRTMVSIAHPDLAKESQGPFKISLLTQLSSNRIEMLDLIAARWSDPINIAVYVKPRELLTLYNKVNEWLMRSKRKNIITHLVINEGDLYPVNWLRNLVIQNCTTEYMFLVDGDFIPSVDLEKQLKINFQNLAKEKNDNTLLIIPAFEIKDPRVNTIPRNKAELLKLMSKNKADVFHRSHYPDGHALWKYEKWKHMKQRYLLYHMKTCPDKPEPYLAMRRSQSPYLPEILLERGKNKLAYFFELCNSGKRFAVLPNEYIIHKLHPMNLESIDRVSLCVIDAYNIFKEYIIRKYNKASLYKVSFGDKFKECRTIFKCLIGDVVFCLYIFLPIIALIYLCRYRSR